MIYLFGSGAFGSTREVVKVGYTADLETRKSQYRLHNPLGEFIKTREGDEILETKLHVRLYDFQVEFLEEWFYPEPEVFEVFDTSEAELDKWLWIHKSECLIYPVIPPPGTLKRRILEDLQKKFGQFSGTKLL